MKSKKDEKSYIYRGTTHEGKYITLPTEVETIQWLKDHGGGVYTNILHHVTFTV